jgi:predicted SnoaL-like aldol condensation-catalyzing enzyme
VSDLDAANLTTASGIPSAIHRQPRRLTIAAVLLLLLKFRFQIERRISMAIGCNITARAKEWFEVIWNQGKIGRLDEFVNEGSIAHLASGPCSAKDAFEAIFETFRKTFPDMQITIEDTVTSGDNVVVRWRFDGTPATHNPATATRRTARGMTWMRFNGETIAEGWDCWNYDRMFDDLLRYLT